MKLFKQKNWHFNVAAWCYFAIAVIFTLGLIGGLVTAPHNLTRSKLIFGIALVIVSLTLGIWLKRIYLEIVKPSIFVSTCSLTLFIFMGGMGLAKGSFIMFFWAIPMIFVLLGIRSSQNTNSSGNDDI